MSLLDAARQAWSEQEAADARQREAEAIAERQRYAAELERMLTLAASTAAELLHQDDLDDPHAWTAEHPSLAVLGIDGLRLRVTATWQRPSTVPTPFDVRLSVLVPCPAGHLAERTPDGGSRWTALYEKDALARLGRTLANPPACETCDHEQAGPLDPIHKVIWDDDYRSYQCVDCGGMWPSVAEIPNLGCPEPEQAGEVE